MKTIQLSGYLMGTYHFPVSCNEHVALVAYVIPFTTLVLLAPWI